MSLTLRDINQDNWIECIKLTTNTDGKPTLSEGFVASNVVSIAQSKIENGWTTKAIYFEETMVGFTMYGFCEKDRFYEVCRLMIDHKFQGKGYGKLALEKVINELSLIQECKEIYLSFLPENIIGKSLYEKVGFKSTGEMVDGELLYVLHLV